MTDRELHRCEDAGAAKGVKFNSPRDKLKEIASANGTNAMNIYMLIKKFEQPFEAPIGVAYTPEMIEERYAGTGLGGKTLTQVCTEVGVPIDLAKARLTNAGMTADANENPKAIAERHSKVPMDVLKHVLVEGYKS